MFIDGTTVFNTHLTEHEVFIDKKNGITQNTGKYSMNILIDSKKAAALAKEGMLLKDYEGTPMRKFSSKFKVEVFNSDRTPWNDEIPEGSEVRLEYTTKANPTYGQIPYVKRVVIKKLGEGTTDGAIFDGIEAEEPPF